MGLTSRQIKSPSAEVRLPRSSVNLDAVDGDGAVFQVNAIRQLVANRVWNSEFRNLNIGGGFNGRALQNQSKGPGFESRRSDVNEWRQYSFSGI